MNQKIVNAISRISRLITDAESKVKDLFDVNDLTSSQLNYIETIGELGNPNVTELSVALGVKKPSVTVAIDKLITKGFVYKTHADNDRRSSHLHLTDVGEQINQRHEFAHEYLAQRIEETLSTDEQELFISLVNKLMDKKS
ncbi:MAG: MarR family transcriptional regulator [Prevotella sp.]